MRAAFGVIGFAWLAACGAGAAPVDRDVSPPPAKPPPPVGVTGTVAGEAVLAIGGEAIPVPRAALALDVPELLRAETESPGVNLRAPPWGGEEVAFRLDVSLAPEAIAGWQLDIARVDAAGATELVRSFLAVGAPPAEVRWDGSDRAGRPVPPESLYVAQLYAIGADHDRAAASARLPFGVDYGVSRAPATEVLRGALFEGKPRKPRASATLRDRVTAIASAVGPGDRLQIERHADGRGDRLRMAARTQREAAVVRELLVAAGIAAERIEARGRGSFEPLVAPATAIDRARNERLIVTVFPAASPNAGLAVRDPVPGVTVARIDGREIALDGAGAFQTELGPDAAVDVQLEAADGRLAVVPVRLVRGRLASPADFVAPPEPIARTVTGDLATGVFAVGGVELPAQLTRIDARLRNTTAGVEIEIDVPPDLAVRSWTLVIRAADGTVRRRDSGLATPPPAAYVWNGKGDDGARLLAAGETYSYRLLVVTPDGSSGASPARQFTVARIADDGTVTAEPAGAAAADARVTIDGAPQPIHDGRLDATILVAPDRSLVLDATLPGGHRALFIVPPEPTR